MPRLRADDSVLVVVDIQERLVPAIHDADGLVANARILLQAAARLGIPALATEQYPRGLGRTIEPVGSLMQPDQLVEKVEFSAAANPVFVGRLASLGRRTAVLCGMEAHVCVLQTALDLVAAGGRVAIVRDAASSRRPASAEAAFARAAADGVTIVTTEMVVFEWLHKAGTAEFRDVSRLIK